MGRHALAYVKEKALRRGPLGRPAFRANFYRSKSRRIYEIGDGGTLWVVTSVARPEGDRAYTLAYKLAGCISVPETEVHQLPYPHLGKYAVMATDGLGTVHYSLKGTVARDFSPHLLRLRFTNKQPITGRGKIGWWLRGFPEPDPSSIRILSWMDRKIRFGRKILLSYAREDVDLARRLEHALEERGLTVWRDTSSLRAGQHWREAIQDNLRIADAFVVLLTSASVESGPVREEIGWALASRDNPEGISGVFPLLGPDLDFGTIPLDRLDPGAATIRLKDLNMVRLRSDLPAAELDRLALEIGMEATREPG